MIDKTELDRSLTIDLVGLYQPLNDEDDGGKDEDWHQERWFGDEVEGNSDCSRDLHLGHAGRHLD